MYLLVSIAFSPTYLVLGAAITNPRTFNTSRAVESAQKCFTGGEVWASDRAQALLEAQKFCTNVGAGTYYAGQQKPGCYNLSSNKKVNFILELMPKVPGRSIDADECYDGMQKEINGCDHGGDTEYTNWHFIADPNAGNC